MAGMRLTPEDQAYLDSLELQQRRAGAKAGLLPALSYLGNAAKKALAPQTGTLVEAVSELTPIGPLRRMFGSAPSNESSVGDALDIASLVPGGALAKVAAAGTVIPVKVAKRLAAKGYQGASTVQEMLENLAKSPEERAIIPHYSENPNLSGVAIKHPNMGTLYFTSDEAPFPLRIPREGASGSIGQYFSLPQILRDAYPGVENATVVFNKAGSPGDAATLITKQGVPKYQINSGTKITDFGKPVLHELTHGTWPRWGEGNEALSGTSPDVAQRALDTVEAMKALGPRFNSFNPETQDILREYAAKAADQGLFSGNKAFDLYYYSPGEVAPKLNEWLMRDPGETTEAAINRTVDEWNKIHPLINKFDSSVPIEVRAITGT